MIHHLQMHVEPSSWTMLPPSGQTRDNNHRLVPVVNRHPKMVEENNVKVRKKEKRTGFGKLMHSYPVGWSLSLKISALPSGDVPPCRQI